MRWYSESVSKYAILLCSLYQLYYWSEILNLYLCIFISMLILFVQNSRHPIKIFKLLPIKSQTIMHMSMQRYMYITALELDSHCLRHAGWMGYPSLPCLVFKHGRISGHYHTLCSDLEPERNPHGYRENIQTPNRKAQARIPTQAARWQSQ